MALTVPVTGKLVDIESKPWKLDNGKEGVSHALYVRTGNERDGAQRIRVQYEQLRFFTIGETVTLPCTITAQVNDYGTPSLKVALDQQYVPAGKHAPAPPAPAKV